ncbi:helix-turn-helix domain-containing protein [Paraburkholderia sp. SIMBA_049]
MFHEKFSLHVAQYGSVPRGLVSFALPIKGGVRDNGTLYGGPFRTGYLYVVKGGQEFVTHTPEEMETVVFAVNADRLRSAANWAYPTVDLDSRRSNSPVNVHLDSDFAVLLSLFEEANLDSQAGFERREKLLEDNLIDVLLRCVSNNGSLERVTLTEAVRCDLVKRCRDIVLAQDESPATILELCQALRVSRRTLQEAFVTVTGISPLHYLRSIRLGTVRQRLQSPQNANKTIGDIAASLGFFHLGRFTSDYKQLFHELPSETKLRSGGGKGFG